MSSKGIAGNTPTLPVANQLTPQKINPNPPVETKAPEAPKPDRIVVSSPNDRLNSVLKTGINRPPVRQ